MNVGIAVATSGFLNTDWTYTRLDYNRRNTATFVISLLTFFCFFCLLKRSAKTLSALLSFPGKKNNATQTILSQTQSRISGSSPTSFRIFRTSCGGSRPFISALSQRSWRVNPKAGPNFYEIQGIEGKERSSVNWIWG